MKDCTLFMNQFETSVKLNVLPLGSYDVLIGMYWLEQNRLVLNWFDKTFTYLNNKGEMMIGTRIPRKTSIRQISTLQLKLAIRKGCRSFAVTLTDEEHINKEEKLKWEDIPTLRGSLDVFSEEILGFPLKREMELTIELVLDAVPN